MYYISGSKNYYIQYLYKSEIANDHINKIVDNNKFGTYHFKIAFRGKFNFSSQYMIKTKVDLYDLNRWATFLVNTKVVMSSISFLAAMYLYQNIW